MRCLTSLFTPPDPLPLAGGAEVHLVEYHHLDDDLDWRTATMVVNFVDTPAVRRVFSTLQGMFVAARSTARVFSGTEGIQQLCGSLRAQQFGTADAVLYTAGNLSVDTDILQEVVDAIRAMGPGVVVVVDDDCQRWRDLVGVSGFLRGAESTSPATATAVAISLATLCAPETLTCLDHEDVGGRLGSADEPSVLVEALWFRRSQELRFTSVTDGEVVKAAESIAVNLCGAGLRLKEFSMIRGALSAWTGTLELVFQAPLDSMVGPSLHPDVVFLPMICRGPREAVLCSQALSGSSAT